MSAVKISISVEPATDSTGRERIEKVIDPEIDVFSEWFATVSGSGVMPLERDILRAYLYNKMDGKF